YSSTADDGMNTQDEETAEDTQSEDPLHNVLMNLEGIDYSVAIENCIDDETLTDALRDFIQTLETKPAEIERYWREKDYRNYTVQVHALKSTARLIGATKLSDDAKYLEQCGDAENASAIDEKTDDLLNLYESYSEKLRPFVNALKEVSGSESAGEPIPDDMFADAIGSVKELVDSFDFGNAEGVLMMLKDYDLTDAQQIKYDTLYKHVRNVDRDAVLAWYEENRE
ncbi:MAG: Hpt domain-containing protein, partial [Eubacterium sp.]|nr:Hpt domain-containing protein [Eubacterium sp.]